MLYLFTSWRVASLCCFSRLLSREILLCLSHCQAGRCVATGTYCSWKDQSISPNIWSPISLCSVLLNPFWWDCVLILRKYDQTFHTFCLKNTTFFNDSHCSCRSHFWNGSLLPVLYLSMVLLPPHCYFPCMHNLLFSHAGAAFYMPSPAPYTNGSANYQCSDTVGSSIHLLKRVDALTNIWSKEEVIWLVYNQ